MKKTSLVLISLIASLTLFSCASTKEIPTDLTAAQIIQKAQNAYEKADYNGALTYYETVIKRYGTNLSTYVEATYEIGHVYAKTKKYELAYEKYQEILDIYSDSYYGDLPSAYKKLAEIGISNIPEKKLETIKADYAAKKAAKSTDIVWDEE